MQTQHRQIGTRKAIFQQQYSVQSTHVHKIRPFNYYAIMNTNNIGQQTADRLTENCVGCDYARTNIRHIIQIYCYSGLIETNGNFGIHQKQCQYGTTVLDAGQRASRMDRLSIANHISHSWTWTGSSDKNLHFHYITGCLYRF